MRSPPGVAASPGPRRPGRLRAPFPPRRAGHRPGHRHHLLVPAGRRRRDPDTLCGPGRPALSARRPGRCGGCDFQHVEPGAAPPQGLRRGRAARPPGRHRAPVEVEPVEGDDGGLGWRSRVRVAVDPEGAVGFRRHRSHELERVDAAPRRPGRRRHRRLATRWPGVSELEVVTGTAPGSLVSVTPRGRRAPRCLRATPAPDRLVLHRSAVREPGRAHVGTGRPPRLGGRVLAGARRCRGGLLDAVLDRRRLPRGTVVDLYAGAGSSPSPGQLGPRGLGPGRGAGPPRLRRRRHNGAGPNCPSTRPRYAPASPSTASAGPTWSYSTQPGGSRHGRMRRSPRSRHRAGSSTSRATAVLGPDARVLWTQAGTWPARAFDIFPMTEHVELVATIRSPEY